LSTLRKETLTPETPSLSGVKMALQSTPWWVVIVAMTLIAMLTAIALFTQSENPILSIAIAGLITLAGITYGLDLKVKQLAPATD
jgi:hypothetical protein